jgi:hypothetical protein
VLVLANLPQSGLFRQFGFTFPIGRLYGHLPKTIDPFESLGERIGLLATVEAVDLERTHSFGETDHGGLVSPSGLLRSWHKCQNVSFNEPIWQIGACHLIGFLER